MVLDPFYVIYLNMVGNKCFLTLESFSEVCKSRNLNNDITVSQAAGGAAGCLRSSLGGQLPPGLMLVARAVSTVLDRLPSVI